MQEVVGSVVEIILEDSCHSKNIAEYHCRQCGAVVCGPCSNKKLLLPGQGEGKAVRVCLQCYDAASKVKIVSPTTDSLNSNDRTRNSAYSSGDDSSGDEDDSNKEANHDEPKFYGSAIHRMRSKCAKNDETKEEEHQKL